MGFLDFFRKKKGGTAGKRLTLAQLVDRLKNEGFDEGQIRNQLLKSFGKEQLRTFGEGMTISPVKVDEIVRDLQGRNNQD